MVKPSAGFSVKTAQRHVRVQAGAFQAVNLEGIRPSDLTHNIPHRVVYTAVYLCRPPHTIPSLPAGPRRSRCYRRVTSPCSMRKKIHDSP